MTFKQPYKSLVTIAGALNLWRARYQQLVDPSGLADSASALLYDLIVKLAKQEKESKKS